MNELTSNCSDDNWMVLQRGDALYKLTSLDFPGTVKHHTDWLLQGLFMGLRSGRFLVPNLCVLGSCVHIATSQVLCFCRYGAILWAKLLYMLLNLAVYGGCSQFENQVAQYIQVT